MPIPSQQNQTTGADIAAADITITRDREEVVNFVKPFQSLGLTILIKKPHFDSKTKTITDLETSPYNFNILSPLAPEVWALITLFVILVP